MEATDWLPCIVTMFDLIGIKRDSTSGKALLATPSPAEAGRWLRSR